MARGVASFPPAATSFVGRRRETSTLKRLLRVARLVTLTGSAGVGKSRLGSHLAEELRPAFADGVWLVELAGLRDPVLLPDTVMMVLGISERPGVPQVRTLVDHVADRRMLLVLDNCEHLVDACAELAHRMLSATLGLRILATSRQPLGVAGEHIWPVPPLPAADPSTRLPARSSPRNAASTLFEQRAAAVVPGFALLRGERTTVAKICYRLDGIPLAIELAAAQLRVLSTGQVLDRLAGRVGVLGSDDRDGTLRTTIDWSFGLCTPAEQLMWVRLSVFAGSFDLETAESVCAGGDIAADEAFDLVAALVEKSVVIREECAGSVRLSMLETIRQYGQDKLGEAATVLRARHRDVYLRLAEAAEADWFGPDQLRWVNRVRCDHADLRAALEFCRTTPGQHLAGLRLVASLWFYWIACGFLPEGRRWLDQLLASDRGPTEDADRGKALWADGYIAVLQGDVDRGVASLEESRAVAQRSGDDFAAARATCGLGLAAMFRDDMERAAELETLALLLLRRSGPSGAIAALAHLHLAAALVYGGDLPRALPLCEEGRAASEARGERWYLSYFLYVLARAEWASGDLPAARAHARQCLAIKQAFNDVLGVVVTVELLAWISAVEGAAERAAVLLGAVRHLWHGFGVPGFGSSQTFDTPHAECEARVRKALGDGAFRVACRRGARLDFDRLIRCASQD